MATKPNFFWPDVSTLEGARWAAKQGVWAAAFVAVATSVVASATLLTHNSILGVSASAFLDAAIFAAVAYGIHRNSRFAAVSGLVIYLLERIYMLRVSAANGPGAMVMMVFLTLAFVSAIRGTLAYQRLTASMTPVVNPASPAAHQ